MIEVKEIINAVEMAKEKEIEEYKSSLGEIKNKYKDEIRKATIEYLLSKHGVVFNLPKGVSDKCSITIESCFSVSFERAFMHLYYTMKEYKDICLMYHQIVYNFHTGQTSLRSKCPVVFYITVDKDKEYLRYFLHSDSFNGKTEVNILLDKGSFIEFVEANDIAIHSISYSNSDTLRYYVKDKLIKLVDIVKGGEK